MFTMKRSEGEWNQFHQLTYEYYQQRKRSFVHGTTKIAEAQREAYSEGFKAFFWEVIASEVNKRRYAVLQHWETIPVMIGADARKIEQVIDQHWTELVDLSPAKKEVDWNAFWSGLETIIDEAVWSQGIADSERERHRNAVLAGNEEPTADDHIWLNAIRQKAKDDYERANQLTMEAGRKKVSSK
jgi:hypothetical protein